MQLLKLGHWSLDFSLRGKWEQVKERNKVFKEKDDQTRLVFKDFHSSKQ